jgi:hypothetical protein
MTIFGTTYPMLIYKFYGFYIFKSRLKILF